MSEIIQRYRFLARHMPPSSRRRVVILTGARQTGKTTLAKKVYPDLPYVNLDAPENRETLRTLRTTDWADTVGCAVLDEAQKEPAVFEKVKYAYDAGDISFSVLTGSSQVLLLKKIRESMAGRAFFYELWPLMQCELNLPENADDSEAPIIHRIVTGERLENLLGSMPRKLLPHADDPLLEAEDYVLQWGGMPALLPLPETERWKWLKDYGYTYLERDLSDLARLDDLSPFRSFQRISALRSASLLNYSELARDTGISVDTAKRYLEYLRISYQAFLLQPYYRNLTSRLVKTPKLYWSDIGLLRRITGFKDTLSGPLYETMVVSELLKWIRTRQLDVKVYFYRTRSGMEMDLMLEGDFGVLGLEAKSRRTPAPKDIRPMKEIAASLGKKWRGGILAYRGDEIKKLSDPDIWAVPSRRLLQPPPP